MADELESVVGRQEGVPTLDKHERQPESIADTQGNQPAAEQEEPIPMADAQETVVESMAEKQGDSEPAADKQEDEEEEDTTKYRTRDMLLGEITYASAKKEDSNVLHRLTYYKKREVFFNIIIRHEAEIKNVIASHLGLRSTAKISVAPWQQWLYGSFNVCIKIDVESEVKDSPMQYMMRYALPYKIGEEPFPGNSDEKVCTEAGTYEWLRLNCPTIPIPLLYGFGLCGNKRFMSVDKLPFFKRAFQTVRRWILERMGHELPTQFVLEQVKPSPLSNMPYILIEYIKPERGQMLINTWEEGRHDPELRSNFYRSLSKIMVSLAKVPLPKIGSFVIDNDGYLRLENRPLTKEMHQLENEEIPLEIPRDVTYAHTGSYVNALLSYHYSKLRHQPNGLHNFEDGLEQTSILTAVRAMSPNFVQLQSRGPFIFSFTDMLQPNIFVDDKWNITALVDLEWACSIPAEMVNPPWWLNDGTIGKIDADAYGILHEEFCTAMAKVEDEAEAEDVPKTPQMLKMSKMMRDTWNRGTFWYSMALNSPTGICNFFNRRLQGLFGEQDDYEFLTSFFRYFTMETVDFLNGKVEDKERYDIALRKEFEVELG